MHHLSIIIHKSLQASTTSSTSTSTTTTVTNVKSIVGSQYVELVSDYGFYLDTDAEFNQGQIKSAIMHYHYLDVATDENGVELYDESGKNIVIAERDDTSDITDRVTFGDATPSNTYVKVVAEDAEFRYDVPVYYRGEELTDAFGEKATVEVYIGVKGDADLNNVVNGSDSTLILKYYAAVGSSSSYVDRDTIQALNSKPQGYRSCICIRPVCCIPF